MATNVAAKARLEKAVKELDSITGRIAERSGKTANGVELPQQELKTLGSDLQKSRAENTRLSAELTQAKEVNIGLQNDMLDIATRLDTAIDTVQAILDE